MNINELKSFIEEVLSNPEKITDINAVMEKALSIYKSLSAKFQTATPKEREEIALALKDVAKIFEVKFDELSKKMGVSKEQLLTAMQDPKNYPKEVWDSVQSFQSNINSERKELEKEFAPTESTAAKISKKSKFGKRSPWVSA